MTSYISLLNKIEAFCNAHLQIKKYKGEFKEQMPNFSTMDEKYPVVFVVPTSDTETLELNQFTLDIYCVDIIQKDRANLNTIVSDCHLILKDLYLYFKDGSDLSVDVITDPTMTPLNNFDLDYVAGWVMTITFEVEGYSVCAIPMNPIPPFTPSCEDATYEITDTDDNVLYSGSIVSGGTLNQVIQDSTVEIVTSTNNPLYTVSVNAEGTATQIIQDSTVRNSDISYNVSLAPETLLTVPDSTVFLNGGNIGNIVSVKTLDIHLHDTNSIDIVPALVTNASNLITIQAPDTSLEVNGTSEGSVVSGSTVDIQLSDSGGTVTPTSVTQVGNDLQIVLPDAVVSVTRSTATLMKSGQTVSYRANDDGAIEAGRNTNFLTLDAIPVHNDNTATINTTTNRFTDTLGGQTYTNNIVLDWSTWNGSTLLGWDRRVNGGGANTDKTWNNAIDEAAAHSVGSFVSGWRLCNRMEAMSICNDDFISTWLDYPPFNFNVAQGFWLSGTVATATTTANFLFPLGRTMPTAAKTGSAAVRWMACRTFSLSTSNVLS